MATYLRKAGNNLKVDLNVSYGSKSFSKSISKTFSEEIIQRKDVDAGKVILACVAQDGTNADLTVNMQLVYHLR